MTIKNIIIVGITGVGKTTIGKFLADSLNRKFIDLDKFIWLFSAGWIPGGFPGEKARR